MRKIILLLLVFSWAIFSRAQTFHLNWKGKKEIELTNATKTSVLFFEDEKHYKLSGNNLPYFILEEENPSQFRYTISDIRKKEISFDEQQLVPHFPTYIDYVQNHIQKDQTFIHTFQLYPFIQENNKYYKIESFTLSKSSVIQPKAHRKTATNTSVLQSGDWYKIKVSKTGVYKLTTDFFKASGIPTSGYDLRTLKIYGNGGAQLPANTGTFIYDDLQENAIRVIGEEDGNFDSNDYILFYAQGPNNLHRSENQTLENLSHRLHLFDEYAYYYITFGGKNGKRISTSTIDETPTKTFTSFDDYRFFERDSLNINQMGKQWVSHPFRQNPNQTFILQLHQPIGGETAHLKASLVGKNAKNSKFTISAADATGNFSTFSQSEFSRNEVSLKLNSVPSSLAVNIIGNNTNEEVFLDKISVAYKAALAYGNEQFSFRFLDQLGEVNSFSFSGEATIWNVSDLTNAIEVTDRKFRKPTEGFHNEFIAFRNEHVFTDIKFVEKVANQNLHAISGVSAVIITPEEFLSEAMRWAQFREQNDDIKVAVATTKQIYNEFSSGSKDAFGIRNFLKFLRVHNNPNLQYAFLFGNATYDPKDRIVNNKDYIPTFLSLSSANLDNTFATDDFYTMLTDDLKLIAEGQNDILPNLTYASDALTISIGRAPARTLAEARNIVNKTISYYSPIQGKGPSYGDWRLKVITVVDDPNNYNNPDINNPTIDQQYDEVLQFANNHYYALRKLYLSGSEQEQTAAGIRYPKVTEGITNGFELGANFIAYFGHGGPTSWAQERILTSEDLTGLNNFNAAYSRLPIVSTVTCDFTIWDLPQIDSAGEQMINSTAGGALVMITTNRPIGVAYGQEINGILLKELFNEEKEQNISVGEALRLTKIKKGSDADHKEVTIIGDPMIALARPKHDIVITKMMANGVEIDLNKEHQIKALDFITIEGEIRNSTNHQLMNNFNGSITNILYEKEVEKNYLRAFPDEMYKEEFNTLYRGKGKVENGKFTLEYYLPKDINYEVGERKLVLYADNNQTDAVTVTKVNVGGLNENNMNDKEIPQGKLYMNNLNFADGGITDRDPILVGCLTDNMGISSSGASIGHDIVATLDGNIQNSFVLNEYYDGGDNNPCINKNFKDYQKGQVMYQLKNLELGQHSITLKFWDINNNSNTASLDFVVMENGNSQLHIDKLLNWPNPFTNNTYFHFEHNCDSELEVLVQIFTVSGKLVKSIKQYVSSTPFREGYRTNKYAIPWDGLDDFGDKIGKGVYIYKVNVRGVNAETCKGSAQAIEKLVILK
ncbi:Uncharacterised protein [Weeksella virosa]|uniref:type IX secretion system sortase PorU n=1 Tax=Weeksella virosa TaxID=1014 RepID=UPI000E005D28|nr:type IX secretion system sortase PorU [Weeksella virosa]SUP53251.1 Uncharacterised protein [Weeksella virosa]